MRGSNSRVLEQGKKGVKRAIAVYGLFSLLAACTGKEEHDIRIKKTVGEIEFAVEYQPSENRETEEEGNEIEYFKVELSHTDNRDIVEHLSEISGMTKEEVLYYLSYRLKDHVFLEQGEKKSENVLYHFERSFDLKRGRVFNVGFAPVGEKDKEITLLIDSELLNTGPVKLKF